MDRNRRTIDLIRTVACAILVLASASALAAGQTIRLADDSNSRLEMKDAISNGNRTTVLFWTWPDRGDPNFREECSKNYYTVTLQPGLPTAEPRLMAKGACAGTGELHGGLLEDDSGKFIVRDRLEHWKNGERLSSKPLASLEQVGSLGLGAGNLGSQLVDLSPAGDLVMAIMVGGQAAAEWSGVTVVLARLDKDNRQRWLLKVEASDQPMTPEQLWAGQDGSALLRYYKVDMTAMAAEPETRLLHVSANGKASELSLMNVTEPFDFASMRPGSQEDLQKFYAHEEQNRSEHIETLAARAREGAGFDVLFRRKSESPDRDGNFLWRIGRDGTVESETALGTVIEDYGLERWVDFFVNGSELVLLGSAQVTQAGVNARRKQWPQTIVSWISVDSKQVVSRLIPLDRQYLEAAMNAGDEGQQYLEGQPGGTPVLLSTLNGVPLSLGQGWVQKRGTLRIFEATDDLVAFTEYRDQQLDKMAKEESRQSKKAARQASQQQMEGSMQSTLGMSSKEFKQLSQEEQMQLMTQDGNMEALMGSLMQQAQSAPQGGGMTAEQAAQMQASMAQVQQMMQAGGATAVNPMAAPQPTPLSSPETNAKPAFTVDALMRGHLRYSHPDGQAATLFIINRESGDELMKKEYPSGEIDEYISLGRYKLPPEQIGALIRGGDGQLLADLSPEGP